MILLMPSLACLATLASNPPPATTPSRLGRVRHGLEQLGRKVPLHPVAQDGDDRRLVNALLAQPLMGDDRRLKVQTRAWPAGKTQADQPTGRTQRQLVADVDRLKPSSSLGWYSRDMLSATPGMRAENEQHSA